MRAGLLATTRWRGKMTADEPGAYAHYLPTHGPNLYDRTAVDNDPDVVVPINGTVYPQWAVGFPAPFRDRIGVRFADDLIVAVDGDGDTARDPAGHAGGWSAHRTRLRLQPQGAPPHGLPGGIQLPGGPALRHRSRRNPATTSAG